MPPDDGRCGELRGQRVGHATRGVGGIAGRHWGFGILKMKAKDTPSPTVGRLIGMKANDVLSLTVGLLIEGTCFWWWAGGYSRRGE